MGWRRRGRRHTSPQGPRRTLVGGGGSRWGRRPPPWGGCTSARGGPGGRLHGPRGGCTSGQQVRGVRRPAGLHSRQGGWRADRRPSVPAEHNRGWGRRRGQRSRRLGRCRWGRRSHTRGRRRRGRGGSTRSWFTLLKKFNTLTVFHYKRQYHAMPEVKRRSK
jgi:hypothetical protein